MGSIMRTMKPLTLALVLAFALVLASSAPAFTRLTELEAKLPTAASVYCADSEQQWIDYAGEDVEGVVASFTQHEIRFPPTICRTLAAGPSDVAFGRAAQVLYHEWAHVAFQSSDEGFVDCIAVIEMRYLLRHYWQLSATIAQPLYLQAWSRHVASPPPYQGTCSFEQRDPLGAY
jgi:hypothetical protein